MVRTGTLLVATHPVDRLGSTPSLGTLRWRWYRIPRHSSRASLVTVISVQSVNAVRMCCPVAFRPALHYTSAGRFVMRGLSQQGRRGAGGWVHGSGNCRHAG